jgi:tRNA U54 and U55 pseudouridine synthase Pus10
MGRTSPSLSDLMETTTDILELDGTSMFVIYFQKGN